MNRKVEMFIKKANNLIKNKEKVSNKEALKLIFNSDLNDIIEDIFNDYDYVNDNYKLLDIIDDYHFDIHNDYCECNGDNDYFDCDYLTKVEMENYE